MSNGSAVEVHGLTKRFGSRVVALDNVSFDVPSNSLFGLLGPNGAGKTTLFSIAANFLQATEGTVRVLGIDVRDISELRGQFSMLPQDALFERNVPIIEQMITFCRLNGQTRAEAEQTSDAALKTVGLTEASNRSARTLSHGMTKRLALAQAFLGEPQVVLLDEPTSGLDPQNAASIRNLVREMAGKRTVVISSHNLNEIQEMCTHCAILDNGHVVSCGKMSDLLGSDHSLRITFAKSMTNELIQAISDLQGVTQIDTPEPDECLISIDASGNQSKDEIVEKIFATVSASGFVPRTVNEGSRLEERFLEMTGGTSDALGST